MSLTNKQRAFVEEYLKDFNATQAAKRAGYKGNDATLAVIGYENLRKPKIAGAINRRLDEKAMSANEVLMRLAEQARADISEFIRWGGAIDWEAVAEKGYLIKRIKHVKGQESSIELYDAQAALRTLGKAHGLFAERQEVGGEITLRVVYDGDGTDDQSSEATP